MRHQRIVEHRIADTDRSHALFAPTFAGLRAETVAVAHLDAVLGLIEFAVLPGSCATLVELPLRDLIGDALRLGARRLIVAHNHPNGDPAPSRADLVTTRRLVEVARPLGIRVTDHLIFAGEDVTSFRLLGLL